MTEENRLKYCNYLLGTALHYMPTKSKNKLSAFTRNVVVKNLCLSQATSTRSILNVRSLSARGWLASRVTESTETSVISAIMVLPSGLLRFRTSPSLGSIFVGKSVLLNLRIGRASCRERV